MGWKSINGNRYYYRSRRVGSRVKTDYRGSGLFAELTARSDELETELRKAELQTFQEEVKRFRQQDQQISDTMALVNTLTNATLLLAGYHQHKRQWRRKRGGRTETQGH